MLQDISLKGGILIIGSLYWDKDEIRREWYDQSLNLKGEIRNVHVPIRYGRVSEKRNYTFTMVFSTEYDTDEKRGKAIFVPFVDNPVSLASLKAHAVKLIKAEYKKRTLKFETYHWDWAALGLLVNPNSQSETSKSTNDITLLINEWRKNYNNFDETFYKLADEAAVLSKDGIFQIQWPVELHDFDFMIAAATMPNVKRYPESKNIADRMLENGYNEYYRMNRAEGIGTFQDSEIDEFLNLKK